MFEPMFNAKPEKASLRQGRDDANAALAEWRAKLPTEQDTVASDPPADEKQEE